MSAPVLTRNPLRTSRSMLNGHVVPDGTTPTEDGMPLAYLYSEFRVEGELPFIDLGHYDADQQVWVVPDGVPTMGVATKTRTSNGTQCGDCTSDDACG
ncbi:MAG TPA: hypothetical protein VEZ42_03795 [Pseudonocardia sp.]|nr:hypothetical protein [Pseudonocardia sp.]